MDIYTATEFWDKQGTEVNRNIDIYRENYYQGALYDAINQINIHGNVLEIGSGNGLLREIYSGPGILSWTHIEPNEKLAEALKSKYPGDTVINSTLENANPGKYDTIVGLCSIHYLNDNEIKIACDSLSDGGRIIFLNDGFVHPEKAADIQSEKNIMVLEINKIFYYMDFEKNNWMPLNPTTCDEIFINHLTDIMRENEIESSSRIITGKAFTEKKESRPQIGEYKWNLYPLDSVPDDIYEILTPEEKLIVDSNRNESEIYLQVANVSCIEGYRI